MNSPTAPVRSAGVPPGSSAPGASRIPAWLRSPRLLLPVALIVAVLLLTAFASVVQDIVQQGESGNGVVPPPAVSPGVDRV